MRSPLTCILAVVLLGCGNDGRGVPVDVDNGACGDQIRFTGEYVDWDFHLTSCGIFNATFAVEGGAMATTAPNGRFDLCIPDQDVTRLAITQPTANSQCTQPPSMYTLPAIAVVRKNVLLSGAFWSGRAFTAARATELSTALGFALDPAKAQVFIHVAGTLPHLIELTNLSDGMQAIRPPATDWGVGASGIEVFLANVEVGNGTTIVKGHNGVALGEIPLAPGTITMMTVP